MLAIAVTGLFILTFFVCAVVICACIGNIHRKNTNFVGMRGRTSIFVAEFNHVFAGFRKYIVVVGL